MVNMCDVLLYWVANLYVMFVQDGKAVYDVLSWLAKMYAMFCTGRYICM